MNNNFSFISNITTMPTRVSTDSLDSSVDFEDIMRQAAMHAASSGLINPPRSVQANVLFNAADDLSLQRIQNQLDRVNSASKRYWVN